MSKVFKGIGKVIGSIVLAPIWLALVILSGVFWVAEKVSGIGIIQWALRFIMGFSILGSIIMGSWSAVLIIGLPAGFLYIFPYISQAVRSGCQFIRGLITHGFWGIPA